MSAAARVTAYALVLLAVFAVSFGISRFVVPTEAAQPPAPAPQQDAPQHDGPQHEEGGHGSPGSGEHGEDAGHGEDALTDEHAVPGLAAAQDGYRLVDVTAPDEVGTPGALSFTVLGPDGTPLVDYAVAHERELHLIVVRSDGAGFRHVHPDRDADGRWSIDWASDLAGSLRVFADFVPAATGAELTLTSTVQVSGEVSPAPVDPSPTTAEVDGYTVEVAGDLHAGEASELTFTITRDGQPVTELQPHLGAFGHLVALRSGDLGYLHVHPTGAAPEGPADRSGPEVTFVAEAPTPGDYLLYLDFALDGEVRTAPFVLAAH